MNFTLICEIIYRDDGLVVYKRRILIVFEDYIRNGRLTRFKTHGSYWLLNHGR